VEGYRLEKVIKFPEELDIREYVVDTYEAARVVAKRGFVSVLVSILKLAEVVISTFAPLVMVLLLKVELNV